MAFRNISVALTLNTGRYSSGLRSAQRATQNFANAVQQANRMASRGGLGAAAAGYNNVGRAATNAAGGINASGRAAGVARNQFMRLSAAQTLAGRAGAAMAGQVTMAGKAFAALKVAAANALSTLGGYIAVYATIRGFMSLVTGAKSAVMDFDAAMVESLAIMSESDRRMRPQLEASAIAISKAYKFSAAEAGEALYFLASAGLNASQSIGALPVVTRFAQAGVMNLAKATEFLMDAQSALGMRSSDTAENIESLTRVSDVLSIAAVASNATVQEFAEALTNKAATAARLVGKDVEEVSAVLAAFAQQGVKGKRAGEQFNMALRDLQTRAIKNAPLFERMGIEVFNSSGQMNHMATIIRQLEGNLGTMNDEQKRGTLLSLGFQDRSVAAIMTLIGLSTEIARYDATLRDAGNATKEIADNQMESLGARLMVLRHQFEAWAIGAFGAFRRFSKMIGNEFAPVLRNVIEIGADMGDALAPFIKGLAVVIGIPIVTTIKAIAAVLQMATGFIRDHSYVATALAVMYMTRFVPAITAGTVGLLRLAATSVVVPTLTAIGTALQVLTTRLQLTYAFAGAAGVVKSAAAGAARGLWGMIGAFFKVPSGVAIANAAMIGFAATVGIGLYAWQKMTQTADKAIASATKGLENPKTIDEHRAKVEALRNEYDKAGKKVEGLGWNMKTFNLSASDTWSALNDKRTADKTAEELEKATIEYENHVDNIILIQKAFRDAGEAVPSLQAIEKEANDLGVDLTTTGSAAEMAGKKVVSSLQAQAKYFGLTGLTSQQYSKLSAEEQEKLVAATEQAAKDLEKAMADWISPVKAYQDALEETKKKMEGFTSGSEIFSGLMSDATEAERERAQKAADDWNETQEAIAEKADDTARKTKRSAQDMASSTSKSVDRAAKNMSRSAEDRAREVKRSAADARKSADDFLNEENVRVSTTTWLDALKKKADATVKWKEDLDAIRAGGGSQALLNSLRDMGEEGLPLVEALAASVKAAPGRLAPDIDKANAELARLGEIPEEEVTATLADWKAKMTKQMGDQSTWLKNLLDIGKNVDVDMLASLGMTPTQLSAALGALGPEMRDAVNELAVQLTTGNDAQRAEAQETLRTFVTVQQQANTLTADTFAKASELAIAATKANAWEATQAIIKNLNLLPAEVEKLRTQFGLSTPRNPNAMTAAEWDAMSPAARNVARQNGYYREKNGGILKFAQGGENHIAQVAKGGSMRLWAEPETGGEAYIPLANTKRHRSTKVLSSVANQFGYRLTPYAWGGMTPGSQVSGRSPIQGQPNVIIQPVTVPVAKSTTYQFGDISGPSMDDVQRTAERRARQAALVGMGSG